MKRFPRLAAYGFATLALVAGCLPAHAQESAPPPAPENSAINGELFYILLLGELNSAGGEPGIAYQLYLEGARKANDASLYQRSIEIALQSRSGDAALQAARAWSRAMPDSREANRYVLQILLALNRVADTAEPLKIELNLAKVMDRGAAISAIPATYAQISDKKLAASLVEQALADYLNDPAVSVAAWTTVGRMRLAAGDTSGALEAARRAQALEPSAPGPVQLALEMMGPKVPLAEPLVQHYLAGKPLPELRMAYVRVLLDAMRYAEAAQQLQLLTTQNPELADAWLVLGSLQAQEKQTAAADASLQRFVTLALALPPSDGRSRGLARAYMALAQVAETRKDYPAAEAWLQKIENPQDLLAAQSRRASLLAKQGKLAEGRALLQSLPARTPEEIRLKRAAEVQLLRDNKQYQAAYDLMAAALAQNPQDADLLYDQAMLAEKLDKLDEMERLLRQLIAAKPDYHHAYNALGYSLAERNMRLPEARELIRKALEFVPNDPFIADSLGWVEFRMGNRDEALRVLDDAFKAKPDAEIAAHLGEVLWVLGQRERATSVWKEGLQINSENETLQETLKRLRVKL
ncbi:tetratricopeptide (TPR) repeat protein [Rhodoferax ferrireducens]|uniref:Tetratricopeptide (TPR) repeat protein n=1 Tax=Rhodoferax ferrireducens TaxID=192843 RepID=A0ABU2CG90_9BURK|nr:tetratricopeptide repeat protein [Rhodoferax ferrireducens]MDR7380348.1 tetratricopeptide (TPR) repeat protein [Rhodoferax ferrireducens]